MSTALTHINFDIVQRSRGNCAVKIMAYDMCSRMTKHDGTAYNFSRKESELIHSEIMLPEGAPVELFDPEALANACELSEKRSDSQTGRLLLFTCPRECPEHLRIPLARTIAQPYVEQGMGVAWAYHNPRAADGSENAHIHFFLTTRAVTPEGLARKKSPEWDRQFREKLPPSPEDPKPKNGSAERARICDRANSYFAKHDLQIRLDPRRLEQQGIDRPPEPDAHRKSWQQWQREGADPEMAPASVARVLRHRKLRRELAEFEENERAVLLASDKRIVGKNEKGEMTMIPWEQDHEGYEPLLPDEKMLANRAFTKFRKSHPDKAEGMDIKAYVLMRQGEYAKSKNEETKMQRKPEKSAPQKATQKATHPAEPWMEKMGGLNALSPELREQAAKSYERWLDDADSAEKRANREDFGIHSYCHYVQERFAERRSEGPVATRATENDPAPKDAKAPEKPKKTIRARQETEQSKQEFASYVHKLLSERYTVPEGLHDFVKRIDISKESGQAVLSLKSGGKIVDTGSEITTDADAEVNDALAAATVATAHARGWTSLTVTGSDEYRYAIAKAAALHEPPISTDVELPRELQREIQEALVVRARAALKVTGNSVAPATKTPGQPNLSAAQAQATAALDRAQARQQAELAGEPKGLVDAKALAEPRIAEVDARIAGAERAHADAREAQLAHGAEWGWRMRLHGSERVRHRALVKEGDRAWGEYSKLAGGRNKQVRSIEKQAMREAKAAQRAHDDWRYQSAVRRSQRMIAEIYRLRAAVAAGDTAILADINAGKITDAISKLTEFENSQVQKARAARTPEQVRGQAIDRAFAEADKSARDPQRKEAAMEAMRAAVGGDAATIQALDSGKIDEALKAAAVWRKKLDDEAAATAKRAAEKKETLEKRLDPPQMAMPQP